MCLHIQVRVRCVPNTNNLKQWFRQYCIFIAYIFLSPSEIRSRCRRRFGSSYPPLFFIVVLNCSFFVLAFVRYISPTMSTMGRLGESPCTGSVQNIATQPNICPCLVQLLCHQLTRRTMECYTESQGTDMLR